MLNINGQKPVRDGGALRNAIGLLEVSEAVRLDILRDGKLLTLDAKVGEYAPSRAEGEAIHPRLAGATLEEIGLNSPLAGKVDGVLIVELESRSPAARAGLRKGDVILAVLNQQRVASPADLRPLVATGDALLINLLRGRQQVMLELR